MSEVLGFGSGAAPFDLEVDSVTLTVQTISLEVGLVSAATVVVRNADGDPLPGRTVTWSSSSGSVIAAPASGTTNSTGVVTASLTALAAGSTTIQASCESVDSAGVAVTVVAVADPPTYSASGSAQIIVTAESRLAGWERPKVRRFNDADQKKANPTDRFFEGMTEGVEVEVVWPSKEVLRRFA